MHDRLGDRMKEYESAYSERAIPLLPICVRLDGKCFHNWCRDLERPYDCNFFRVMGNVTKFLVTETQARLGYTQSDEITLIYYSDNTESKVFFDGKLQKMVSILASMASVEFNHSAKKIPRLANKPAAYFDCRVWQVPTLVEATNVLVWREHDCTRNSITMAAQTQYSHKQLLKKSSSEMQEMLFQKGINWNDYPTRFKRGLYIARRKVEREFTLEEMNRIPPSHRPLPGHKIVRSEVVPLDLPPICRILNRVGVFFNGEEPTEASS